MVVVGGGGTKKVCLGGLSPSDKSTFTYVFRESPREDSGSHASSKEAAVLDFADVEEDDVGRESGAGFCCRSAM